MKYFKPILCIHIAALILGAILLLAIPFEDKLRWNMGYVVSWTVFLSALVVSCRIPSAIKFRKLLKAYLIVFWSLPVAGLCCMGFYAFYFPFLIKGTFIPSATIVGNKQYVLLTSVCVGIVCTGKMACLKYI